MAEFENDTFVEEGGEGPSGMPRELEIRLVIGAQCIIGVVGLLGNILALYHYIRRGERRTYTIGIISLAAKDLLNCFIVMPKSIIVEANEYRMSSDFLCKMSHFVDNVNFIATLFLLMILAIDRCVCISHDPRHSLHWKAAVVVVIVILVVALGLGLVPALGVGIWREVGINHGNGNSTNSTLGLTSILNFRLRKINLCHINGLVISGSSVEEFFNFVTFVTIFSSTVCVVAYAVVFVVVVYRRHGPAPNSLFQNQQSTGVNMNPGDLAVEDSSAKVAVDIANSEWKELEGEKSTQSTFALMFFVLTVVCWITNLPAVLMVHRSIIYVFSLFMMHQIPYGLNPLIYLAIDKDFRQEVKDLFQSTWRRFRQW